MNLGFNSHHLRSIINVFFSTITLFIYPGIPKAKSLSLCCMPSTVPLTLLVPFVRGSLIEEGAPVVFCGFMIACQPLTNTIGPIRVERSSL